MRKLIEDDERKIIQAKQSVGTFRLPIEDSYGGSNFSQYVMEYARKGKV